MLSAMKLKILAAALAASALLLAGCSSAPAQKPTTAPLKIQSIGSMAVLGDSISVATATCGYNSNCNENSWATGSAPGLKSFAQRLGAEEGSVVTTYNDAVPGARARDLAPQVSLAVQQKADYVTILIGGNDYCAADINSMTSPTAYQQQLASVLATFKQYLPKTLISLASVPNPAGVYAANSKSAAARQVWSVAKLCPSLLASPTSTSQDAKDRRQFVLARAQAYNQAAAAVCAQYANCHYDDSAVFNQQYSAADLSDLDYFHPSLAGQRKIAADEWAAMRDWLRKITNPVQSVILPS